MSPALSRGSFFYPGPITVASIQEEMLAQFSNKLVSLEEFPDFEAFSAWWREALLDDDVETFRSMFIEAFNGLSPQNLTYTFIIDAYKSVLRKNRGKAIDLGGGVYAVLDARNQLIRFDADIAGDFSSGFESVFESSAYDEGAGAWDNMTREATIESVEKPKLLILPQG
jgi:hypothetical protein